MHAHATLNQIRTAIIPIFAASLTAIAPAIDLVEDFDGAALDTAVWENHGPKAITVSGGSLNIAAEGPGNWDRADIKSEQRFYIPETGQTTVIEWTLGVGAATAGDTGQSIRYQIGIESSNETDENPEHYWNSTGGVWIDVDNIAPEDTATAGGAMYFANDTKGAGAGADNLGGVTLNWNWETENTVLRLELTDTGYTWFDSVGEIGTQLWVDAGIDREFDNGFRVIAIGMNFDGNSGTTSYEKITVTDGQGPPPLLNNFISDRRQALVGQDVTFSWEADPTATISIDQGVGNVDAQTTAGVGSIAVTLPDVTETTILPYTLTVTGGGETLERIIDISVSPVPTGMNEDLLDHFDDGFVDFATWEELGTTNNDISNSLITWGNISSNWGHGEIASVDSFTLPEAGETTTITWTLGPATVTQSAIGDDMLPIPGQAIRPQFGIHSALEDNTGSRQHWQNDEGGLWLDITNLGSGRTDGVSGNFIYADENKGENSNGTVFQGFDVLWNWETENIEFSLVLTDTGFTWFNGPDELASSSFADLNLQNAFLAGYKVNFALINWDNGRGSQSLDSIQIEHSGGSPAQLQIIDTVDNGDGSLTLTWNSVANAEYTIETSTDLETWEDLQTGVAADAATKAFTFSKAGDKRFYRVFKE